MYHYLICCNDPQKYILLRSTYLSPFGNLVSWDASLYIYNNRLIIDFLIIKDQKRNKPSFEVIINTKKDNFSDEVIHNMNKQLQKLKYVDIDIVKKYPIIIISIIYCSNIFHGWSKIVFYLNYYL